MNSVVIGIGSNIDPAANVKKACAALEKEFSVRGMSAFFPTKPLGFANQADFLNGVVLVETEMGVDVLRKTLKDLEVRLGRQSRENKWGPREIDLDVLIVNGQVVNDDYYERDFLQKAVREILPGIKLRCC